MKINTGTWPLAPEVRTTKDPNCLRLVTICDPHLCAYSPASYKTDYWELTRKTLALVINHAAKINADAILWAGDIFHLKSAARNPTWFMAEVIETFRHIRSLGIESLGIAGNHDIKFGTVEAGLWGQPLDLLIRSGFYHLLDIQPYVYKLADGVTVKVAGASYRYGHAHTARDQKKNGATFLITAGHFWFGRETGEFYGEPVFGPDYLGVGETDLYVIGHHHEDQGIVEIEGKKYLSAGSLSRTGTHKHDLNRRVAAGQVTVSAAGVDAKVIRPKTPPADEIMDLEKRKQVVEEQAELNQFIAAMAAVRVASSDPKVILDELAPSTEVKNRVLTYLANAEAET